MKFRKLITHAIIATGIICGLSACSDDKKDSPDSSIFIKDEDGNISLTIKNPEKWIAAAKVVAQKLHADATEQLNEWMTEKAAQLENQAASESISDMIDECADEVNDVATEKIPSPLAVFTTGDDCVANLGSVRNVLLGSLDGSVSQASIMAMTAVANPALAQKISAQLADAVAKIQAIPQPLRENANSTEAKAAIAACLTLEQTLDSELKPMFKNLTGHEAEMQAIVHQYADGVVTPSLAAAQTAADELLAAVNALPAQPSEQHIQAAVVAYVKARAALDLCGAFLD